MYDACIMDNHEEQICNSFAKFTKLCPGEDISGWREKTKCRMLNSVKKTTHVYLSAV